MLSPPTVISSLRESVSQSLPRLVKIDSMVQHPEAGAWSQKDGLILAADLETKPFVVLKDEDYSRCRTGVSGSGIDALPGAVRIL